MRRANTQLVFAAVLVLSYLLFGTWFFSWQEHWRPFDAFYFSAMTLTTVGYGDYQPSTDYSKMAAVFFAFSGISIIFYALSIFAREYFEHQEERIERFTRRANFFKDPMELSRDEKRVEDMTLSELIRRVRRNNRR